MSAFTIRVEGNLCTADRAEIRRALSLLLSAGDIHEIRGLPSGRSILIKKDDLDRAEEAAAGLSEGQVYWSLNPIRPDHMRATDGNVARRRWLLIDVDTIRPEADSSSTDAEKSACGALAVKIAEWLAEHGWPSPIITDSGNGWHLLYRIDLPNDPLSKQIIRSLLKSLASRFDTAEAKVDQSVYNASRIAKLPGTMARKGRETEDRPHRMARIAWEPERIEVVSIEMLRAMEGPEPSTPPDVVPFRTLATDGGKSAYIRAATEGELLRVALASEGDRNNALNRAAFSMAQFHLWPGFNEQEAKARLRLIAERAGLGIQEIDRTIASGWEAGRKEPRPRPIDVGANGKAMNGQEMPSQGPLTIRASEVKPEEVRWIWPNVIARNFLNLFAGRTGIGKSFIMCDVAARLSRGLPMPDGTNTGKVSNTLFISEDPYQYVLVPRLMELGAAGNASVSRPPTGRVAPGAGSSSCSRYQGMSRSCSP